jgi:hypothetical protein
MKPVMTIMPIWWDTSVKEHGITWEEMKGEK